MNFRIAKDTDIDQLVEMRWLHECEEDTHTNEEKDNFLNKCRRFLEEELEKNTLVCWIVEDNGEIISNIYVCKIKKVPKPKSLNGSIGYVTNVHTKKIYRNKGIGTKLLEYVTTWAKKEGMELLFVWPSERAVTFYERAGFSNKNDIMELILNEQL